jgi:hypothetical protein
LQRVQIEGERMMPKSHRVILRSWDVRVCTPLRSIHINRENIMSKTQNSKKQSRKSPLKSAKQKKQAKLVKKTRAAR